VYGRRHRLLLLAAVLKAPARRLPAFGHAVPTHLPLQPGGRTRATLLEALALRRWDSALQARCIGCDARWLVEASSVPSLQSLWAHPMTLAGLHPLVCIMIGDVKKKAIQKSTLAEIKSPEPATASVRLLRPDIGRIWTSSPSDIFMISDVLQDTRVANL
jgi:hypothetical protein